MKVFFCTLLLGVSFLCQSQKLSFPAANFSDANSYEETMSKLAAAVIPVYTNPKKDAYYNDLFRFHFARKDYKSVIQALDSLDAVSTIPKDGKRVLGYHYRIHSMTMLALQNDNTKEYNKEFAKIFNALYNSFPEGGKNQAKSYYNRADAEGEKEAFIKLAKQYQASGSDSIYVTDAIGLIKQWNYWIVYGKTLVLAKAEFEKIDEAEKSAAQSKLLGLDEGAILSPSAKTFITNVTYLDVEKQKLISNATIGITGITITSISTKSKLPLPADATVIDGTGKFLSPGFTDAHIHFFQSGGLYARPEGFFFKRDIPYEKEIEWTHLNMKDFLKRYIQAGITSVIDVGATLNFLELRDKYKDKSFAPSVYMTGPLITTDEPEVYKSRKKDEPFSLVATPDEGRQMVEQQLPYRPDFIKIWYILERGMDKEVSARKYSPIIKAIIEEAHKNNLKVAVHATERIAAQLAVENGCDYLVHSVDDEIVSDDFLKLLKNKNVVLCPTLIVYNGYSKVNGQELDFSVNELRKSNPVQLGSLYDVKHLSEQSIINNVKNAVRNNKAAYASHDSICLTNLKKMMDAGIRIAAGTDAGNTGTLHATSFINELNAMKKSGISNWQILQSATINPTYILGKEKELGSIAVGKKADLVLLNANPVDDLQNLEQISLVINKGHIIKPDTLIKETPLALVQRQLNAYNARNLEAFLEPYAEDVEIYIFPDKLQYKGKEEMRKQYAFFKNVPDLHCEIKERIIQGNTIIDKESVSGFGGKPVEATAIYQVENNKIKKVYFLQ
jgi:imidazolonepropionase-like amidohydrolase